MKELVLVILIISSIFLLTSGLLWRSTRVNPEYIEDLQEEVRRLKEENEKLQKENDRLAFENRCSKVIADKNVELDSEIQTLRDVYGRQISRLHMQLKKKAEEHEEAPMELLVRDRKTGRFIKRNTSSL